MKKRIAWILILSLLLSGCGAWMDGEYYSITPHTNPDDPGSEALSTVSTYEDICNVLENMVRGAVDSRIVSVAANAGSRLALNINQAIRYIKSIFPLGAYAVEDITYEIGVRQGLSAVAFTITYNHNRNVLPSIRHVANMATAKTLISTALNQCDSSLVLYVENYTSTDCLQFVRDYALANPAQVMETPKITETHYPANGNQRVIEFQITYQSSRSTLRNMQDYVQPVFSSAALYVRGETEEQIKFERLYSFLMQRNSYRQESSITPAYSLLRHGVGDSRAFASVYAAMCQQANLDCRIIFGTRNGQPWYWNIIRQDGQFYHVDLLYSYNTDQFCLRADSQMEGYVWDYATYPACTTEPEAEQETQDADPTEPVDPTEPSDPAEPSEPTTEPTEPPTEPTAPDTDSTEPTTAPSEDTSESADESNGGGTF